MFLDIYFVQRVLNGGLTVMEVIVTWTHLDLHTTKMEEVTLYMTGNSTLTLYLYIFYYEYCKTHIFSGPNRASPNKTSYDTDKTIASGSKNYTR